MNTILQWIKTNRIMLVNTASLVGATAVTSGLGFVYWWIAARRFPPESIGIASVAVSAMMLLGGASVLGLGTLLITEIPRQPGREGSLISTALIVSGGAGFLLGLLFALFAPMVSPGFRPLSASPVDVLTFALGNALWSSILVLDQALIGLLKGELQFWRNAAFALLKLLVLFAVGLWPSQQEGMRIFATWFVASVLSLGVLAFNIFGKKSEQRMSYWPQWGLLRKLGLAALQHHMLNLTLQAPTLLLPVLVTVLLSATMNAWFYVAWMLVSFVFIVPGALTTVLHAMNSAQQAMLARKARMTIGIALLVSLLANAVLQFGSSQILGLFGSTYATGASWSLRILVIAAFPLVIKNHYISFCRIQDRIIKAMQGMIPGGLLELGAAAVGAQFAGLLGLCAGWVIAISIEAVFMLPTVYKVVRYVPASQEADLAELEEPEVWQQETLRMPIIPEPSDVGAVWLMNTSLLPAITINTSAHRAIPKVATPETPIPAIQPLYNQKKSRLKPPRLQRLTSSLEVPVPSSWKKTNRNTDRLPGIHQQLQDKERVTKD